MQSAFGGDVELDNVDFLKLYAQAKTGGETFSEMLLRLIKESGEKNSTIYNRANIDRRHFSKIATHEDYQPSKQTVLAFAIALKLDFERTKDLPAVAGFSLTKSNIADLIVAFFIEYKIFDVDLVNRILHKYDQPLLGGFNSMILFDHESIVLHDRVEIAEEKTLTEKDYEIHGTTALLDAIGDAVKHIKNVHKYAREEDRPQKTLFVITTDDMENASEHFSYRDIKELVGKQKERGWEFIFPGANIDAIKVAGHFASAFAAASMQGFFDNDD